MSPEATTQSRYPPPAEFDLLEPLPRGSLGSVQLVADKRYRQNLDRLTIKLAFRYLSYDNPSVQALWAVFERQVKTALKLRDRRLVPCYEILSAPGGCILTSLPFGEHKTLAQEPPEYSLNHLALEIIALCQAVEKLHQLDIAHGNITPWNVLTDRRLRLILADTAVSALQLAERHRQGRLSFFNAPELSREPVATPKCDQYSIARLLQFIFSQRSYTIGYSEIPAVLVGLVNKATSADPAARFASLADFRVALGLLYQEFENTELWQTGPASRPTGSRHETEQSVIWTISGWMLIIYLCPVITLFLLFLSLISLRIIG